MTPMTTTTIPTAGGRTAADVRQYAEQIAALMADVESELWADAPAVQRAIGRQRAVQDATAKLTALLTLPSISGVVSATFERLAAGEDVTASDFQTALASASATSEAGRAAAEVTMQETVNARGSIETSKQQAAHTALRRLDATLQRLVVLARPVIAAFDRLEGTERYAEIGEAAAALQRAVAAHLRIRLLQRDLTQDNSTTTLRTVVEQYGIIRDVTSLRPWADDIAPLEALHAAELPSVNDGEALLRLVCRTDVQAWVPTAAELLAAKEETQRAVAAARHRRANPGITTRPEGVDPRPTVTGDWNASRTTRAHDMPPDRLGDLARYHSNPDDPDAA